MTQGGRARLGGSRSWLGRWLAAFGLVASLLVAAVAAPTASAAGTQTQTVWVPLICQLGTVTVHWGVAMTATVPASVVPNEQFELQNAYATLDFPGDAQNAQAFAFGNPSQIEGALTTFDASLTNAIAPTLVSADTSRTNGGAGTWSESATVAGGVNADPNIASPEGSPAVINLVAAAQPPNADAPGPLDPLINGPSPIAGFPDYPETPLEGVFSWGPAPTDGSGRNGTPGGNPTTNAYAPVPGSGGGPKPTSGTPDPLTVGPLQATGAPGQAVTLAVGASTSPRIQIGKSIYQFVLNNDVFLFETTGSLANSWSADAPVACAVDTTSSAVPSPDPSYLSVATGIQIPIEPPSGTTPPTVTAVSPANGPAGGGNTVTVAGTGFGASDTVDFGSGNPGTNVAVASGGTSLTVVAPPGAGTVDVTVTDPTSGTSATGPADSYTYAHPVPAISSVTPGSGTIYGGTTVTLAGSGFDPATPGDTVDFGMAAATVTAASTTSLTVVAPPGAAGSVPVTVTTDGGTSNASSYTYVASPPTVSSITPASGSTAGGTVVTLLGAGFDPTASGDTVTFGTSTATVTAASTTSLTVRTPPAVAGPVGVTVQTPVGVSAGALTYTYVPVLQSTQPVGIWTPLVCDFGSVIHIGAEFDATVPAAVAPGESFNLQNASLKLEIPASVQNALAFAFGNPSEVEGVISDLELGATGATAPALVNADTTRTDGGLGTWGPDLGGASADPTVGTPSGSPAYVNVVAAEQPPNGDAPSPLDPLINGPSPIIGFPDYPEAALEGVFSWGPAAIDGSGINGTAGGNPTTNAYAPAPGSGGGTVPGSGTADPFTVGPFVATTATGQSVTLTLGEQSRIETIGASRYTYVLASDLFFYETTGSLASQWSADTPLGCGLDTTSSALPSPNPALYSDTSGFSIPIVSSQAAPAITTLAPAQGPTAGGTAVTITGTGFAATASGNGVRFGSTPATVTAASATSLTMIAPPGSAGPVSVTVSTADGTSTAATYTYVAPPAVTSVSPSSGSTAGGTSVTIKGSGFSPAAAGDAVAFGGVAGTVTAASATSLTVTTPTEPAGKVAVTVTTAGGSSNATVTYTFVAPPSKAPSVSSVTPSSGGPFSLTLISGKNLAGATAVTFGGHRTFYLTVGGGLIVALAPPGVSGTVDVQVSTRAGTSPASSADKFTYK